MNDQYPFSTLPVWQHTLAGPLSFEGVGLHLGVPARLSLSGTAANTGLVFRRTDVQDKNPLITLYPGAVCQTRRGTSIGNVDGVTIATAEHLLAALYACGVDNACIDLHGPEIPAMDGSALDFARSIVRVGVQQQSSPRRFMEIIEPVEVLDDAKSVRLEPFGGLQIEARINYPKTLIGDQMYQIEVNPKGFMREIASARTFVLAQEISALREADLALGGSLDNCIVVDGMTLQNKTELRFKDEFVRHKILDILGDLALAGAPILGRFISDCAGHALNNALLQAMARDRKKWRWTELV